MAVLLLPASERIAMAELKLRFCLDEGIGLKATDSSGQGHTGTLTNTPDWIAGKYFYALNFNGTKAGHQYVSFGPNNAFDMLGQGTIMAWIKQASSSAPSLSRNILYGGNGDGTGAGLYIQVYADGFEAFALDSAGQILLDAEAPLPGSVTEWHHVAYVVSATGNLMYTDGILNTPLYRTGSGASTHFFAATSAGTTIYRIGYDPQNEDFDGIIDDVRVYDMPLSGAEIQTAMLSPGCPRMAPACPGDCNDGGSLVAAEIDRVVTILSLCSSCTSGAGVPATGCPAVPGTNKQCTNADYDRGGCISAGELTRVVSDLQHFPGTNGCPPAN